MSMLSIRKLEGDFENVLVRDVQTQVAAHVQIPVGAASRRVVVAMPAGKAALGFETAQPAGWTLEDELRPFADADGQRGVEFALVSNEAEISIPTASILLHHTLMARFGITGTVRASFALYNTREDVDAFIAATAKAVEMLR